MPPTQRIVRVSSLGEATLCSPLAQKRGGADDDHSFTAENAYVRDQVVVNDPPADDEELLFERAGARAKIFFDPRCTKAAVVTCGGLCPGLNNVIRSIFLELHMRYGVPEVLGIRYGFQGLVRGMGEPPLRLSLAAVDSIHESGGTLLGSSRGNQEPAAMVDFLQAEGINLLFCVGGDGTQRGAHAVAEEVKRRGRNIAVIGVPKTIDNDIGYCDRTFGFVTAVAEAQRMLTCAHVESKGAPYGIGLVKLMGREAGFITAAATVASQEVNFALIPEAPFRLDGERGLLAVLRQRLLARRHAVIAVAEGAGQELFADEPAMGKDASGNVKFHDIGLLLKERIECYFKKHGPPVSLKYIDPSYAIRSVPANCEDDMLCDQFARRAVHAAMAGKTDLVIGFRHSNFIHVPIPLAVETKRRVDIQGEIWNAVLATTGQPREFA